MVGADDKDLTLDNVVIEVNLDAEEDALPIFFIHVYRLPKGA
jgi:hypothetical protein